MTMTQNDKFNRRFAGAACLAALLALTGIIGAPQAWADLTVGKFLSNAPIPIVAGSVLEYTVTAANPDAVAQNNVTVSDPLITPSSTDCATLAPGATCTLVGTYTVTQADMDAGVIDNTGSASSDETAPTSAPLTTPLPQYPVVMLTKTADQASFDTAGDVLTYTFTVTNPGNVTLTNIIVTDPTATVSGGPIATLAPGASDTTTYTASYTVTQADLDMGGVTNTATVEATPPSGPNVRNTSSAHVFSVQNPAVSIVKTADQPGYSYAGDVLTYTFTVTNTGNVTLTNVVVNDPLATVSGSPIATLAPGASDTATYTASYTVLQADVDAGSFTNTANVTAVCYCGTVPPASDSETVSAVPPAPSIALVKTANQSDFDAAGDVLTYSFTVENTGNVALTNVTVTDPVAAVSGSPIASLAPGASDSTTFTASYTVTQADVDAGSFTNAATVTGTPPAGPDVTADDDATVPAAQTAGIFIEKNTTKVSYSAVGEVINYTFRVSNTGNVTLTNVTVTDPQATVSGGPITLAPGELDGTTFTATYAVTQADLDTGSFYNTATATGTPPSGPPVASVCHRTVPAVQSPSISLDKDAVQANYDTAGDVLAYTFTVTNTGNVTLTNVTVSDPLATVSGGPIASLAPGASDSATFTASYTVTQADVDAGSFTNAATVTGTPPAGPDVTADDEATVPAAQAAAISLGKAAVQSSFDAAGDVLAYTFTVTNTGNVTLTNVTVSDPLATVSGGTIASLAPGASDNTTFTASYTTTQADVDAGLFTNTATVTGSPPSGPVVTDSDTATVSASVGASISLVKTAMQESYFAPGDVLTYTFTVANTGNVTLTNLTLTDPVTTVGGGTIAALAPGATDTATFTASYAVTQADVDRGYFTNTATVTGTYHVIKSVSGPAEKATVSATASATVPPNYAAIQLVKTPLQTNFAAIGDVLNYTFTVTNAGIVTLTNVIVTDPSATVAGGPIASLAPGASDSTTFTATHTVTQADVDAGSYGNTATATGTPPSGPDVTDSDTVSVPALVVPNPSIQLVKTAQQTNYAAAGDVLTYAFTVTNTGNVTLTNVTVTDPSATVLGGPLATLAPGASDSTTFTASHTVTQTDVDAGSFANTATGTGTPPSGPPVTDTDTVTVPAVTNPGISVVKTAMQTNYNAVGDVLTYTFTVTNTGNVTLTGVTVTDPSATVAGGPITLAPGASDSTTFTASHTVTQADLNAGSFANTATTSGTPPSGPPVTDTDTVTVPAVTNPGISVVKTAMQTNYNAVGDVLTYTFTVTNTGNVTLTGVTVTDPSATVAGGPITLAPGASDSTTFTASHTVTQADLDAGAFANTATTSGTPPSGPPVSDSDSVRVPAVTNPGISVVKTAMRASYGSVGDVLAYSFTVTNTGNVTLTNVTVTDPSATVSGGPLATLAPGASDSATFTASHTVTQADINAGSYANTATTSGNPPSGPPVSDDDTVTVTAVQTATVSLAKEAVPATFSEAGDVITYRFTITNTGNVSLYNVTLSDTLIPVTGGPIAELAPGASDSTTFTGTYTVTEEDVANERVVNVATVHANNLFGPPVTATDDAVATLDPSGCKGFNLIAIILGALTALGTLLGVCFSGC